MTERQPRSTKGSDVSALEVPEEARRAAREALAQTAADTLDVVAMADATLGAAAPLIVAAAYDQLADVIAAEEGSGSFSSGILRAVVKIQQSASVLRGEGQ
jgi:hypothetical protein